MTSDVPAVPLHTAVRRALRPPLPKEHGTWAWLLLPALIGLLAIGWPSAPAWLVFGSAVFGFLLRAAMDGWRASQPRRHQYLVWAVVFGIGLHLMIVPPVTHWHRWVLLPLGAGIGIGPLSVQTVRWLRIQRRVLGEAVVVASLSLLAPAVAYAGTGEFDRWTGFLWLPAALYLWGSITFVRMSLAPDTSRATRMRQERRRTAALYHAGLPVALAASVAGGAIPALVTLAYIPMMAKAAYALWCNAPADSVQKLGIWEAIHAAAFAALLITLYRLAG